MKLELNFNYPTILTYEDPGTFRANAFLTFSHLNNDRDIAAWVDLELEGDLWLEPPKCYEEAHNSKDLSQEIQVSNDNLQVNAECDYLAAYAPECNYLDAWWFDDEPTFAFDVSSYVDGFGPQFYVWVMYKE